jgi:hypothetical protein
VKATDHDEAGIQRFANAAPQIAHPALRVAHPFDKPLPLVSDDAIALHDHGFLMVSLPSMPTSKKEAGAAGSAASEARTRSYAASSGWTWCHPCPRGKGCLGPFTAENDTRPENHLLAEANNILEMAAVYLEFVP